MNKIIIQPLIWKLARDGVAAPDDALRLGAPEGGETADGGGQLRAAAIIASFELLRGVI